MNQRQRRGRGEEEKRIGAAEGSRFFTMVRKYLGPYSKTLWLLIATYAGFTILTAVQPLVLAPVLELALNPADSVTGSGSNPISLGTLDLNNLGQFVLGILGLDSNDPIEVVFILAIAYLVVTTGLAVLGFINYLLALKVKIGAGRDIQVDLFNHLFSLSLDFFNRERIGELVARLDQDTRNAIAGIELSLRNILVSPILIIYFGYLMFRTNINLTIFVVIAGLLHYLLTQIIRNPIRSRMREQFNVSAEVTAFLQERLAGARVVKTFIAEIYESSRLRHLVDQVMKANTRYGFFKQIDEPVTTVINALINVCILVFSANELFNNRLTTSGFFLYLYVGRAILGPITTLTQTYNSIQSTLAAGMRVRELFDTKPIIISGPTLIHDFNDSIRFDHVFFTYAEKPTLRNLNLRIPKKQTVALVGPSGAGKSTLVDLLMRFYDPSSGKIIFDGLDLRELDLSNYRKLFGVVAQDNLLFNLTIAENIAYARPEIQMDNIVEAASIANADEFIRELPKGYNTLVGDRGVRLSGGQRQRIAIARAVVHHPQILILDEATSSLDTESEKKVQIAVDRAIQSTTAVVIAHRLSTIQEADQIIVLNEGEIIDAGSHEELMERCVLYARLATMQFGLKKADEYGDIPKGLKGRS